MLLASAGLPRIRLHDLRHSCATLLLARGVGPRVVMETLGHSQVSLTLNTCSHVLPVLQRDAADKINAIHNVDYPGKAGDRGGDRTHGPRIKSALLYH